MSLSDIEKMLKEGGVGVRKVLEVNNTPAVAAGENFNSEITRSTIKVVMDSGATQTLRVIIKNQMEGKIAEIQDEIGLFWVEIKIYTQVIPKMEELFEKHLKNYETLWPRCFGTRPHDKVIMEDLKFKGFQMADRLERLDLVHASLVLKCLARYHAASVVLIDKGMIDISDINMYFIVEKKLTINSQLLKANIIELSKAIMESWGTEWADLSGRVLKFANEFQEKSAEICKLEETSFHVLNHGDLWINNFLFRVCPNTGELQSLKFIDFQVSHYNTPSIDLQYFFHMSLPTHILENHYDELLQIYHSALVSNFKSFDHTPKNFFSLEDLKLDMEKKLYVGLLVSVAILPIILSARGESVDLEQLLEKEDNKATKKLYNGKALEQCLKQVLPKFVKKGLL